MTKSIFITGAAAGIGAEAARLFLRKGWRVCASDRDAAALERLRREAGSEHLDCQVADVCDRAAVERAIDAFAEGAGSGGACAGGLPG